MLRPLRTTLTIFTLAVPTASYALGLGDIHVQSALHQALVAQIELVGATDQELTGLTASLASDELFQKYNLERAPFTFGTKLTVGPDAQGRPVLNMRSPEKFTEPVVTLLVDLHTPRGELVREYTLFLDPAGLNAASEPAAVSTAGAGTNSTIESAADAGSAAQSDPHHATTSTSASSSDLERALSAAPGNNSPLSDAHEAAASAPANAAVTPENGNREHARKMRASRLSRPHGNASAATRAKDTSNSTGTAPSRVNDMSASANAPPGNAMDAAATSPPREAANTAATSAPRDLLSGVATSSSRDAISAAPSSALRRSMSAASTSAPRDPMTTAPNASARDALSGEANSSPGHAPSGAAPSSPRDGKNTAVSSSVAAEAGDDEPDDTPQAKSHGLELLAAAVSFCLLSFAGAWIYLRRRNALDHTMTPRYPVAPSVKVIANAPKPESNIIVEETHEALHFVDRAPTEVALQEAAANVNMPDAAVESAREAQSQQATAPGTKDENNESSWFEDSFGTSIADLLNDATTSFEAEDSAKLPFEKSEPTVNLPTASVGELTVSTQASMAGEAGRGFAVVADEVQRLDDASDLEILAAAELEFRGDTAEQKFAFFNSEGNTHTEDTVIDGMLTQTKQFEDNRKDPVDLLREAIEREPDRTDLRLKLVELYYKAAAENRRAFLDATRQLNQDDKLATPEDWDRIADMGRIIAPDHELFSSSVDGKRVA